MGLLFMSIITNLHKNIDPDYIKTFIYAFISIITYVVNDILMRYFGSLGFSIFIYFVIRSIIQITFMICLFMWRAGSSLLITLQKSKSKYWFVYLVKGFVLAVGNHLWVTGDRMGDYITPMYLISFASFANPIFARFLSCLLCGYQWYIHIDAIVLCSISLIPIAVYMCNGLYTITLSYVIVANLIYGVFAVANEMNIKKHAAGLYRKWFPKFADNVDSTMVFHMNNTTSYAIGFGTLGLLQLGFTGVKNEILKICALDTGTMILYLLGPAFLTMIALFSLMQSYRLKGSAAAQMLKAFEPLVSGAFFAANIGTEVTAAVILFFIGAGYAIYRDSRPVNRHLEPIDSVKNKQNRLGYGIHVKN